MAAIRGIDVHEDGADRGCGVLNENPFVAVGRPDADPVAPGDAAREQASGHGIGLVDEFAVGRPVSLVGNNQRLAFRHAIRGAPQVLADGFAEQLNIARAVGIGHGRQLRHLPCEENPRPLP